MEKEIAEIKANASRLIHSNLGQLDQSAFVAEELGRMERQVEGLSRRLHLVTTELVLLEHSPTTEAGLLAEIEVLDRIWNELFPAEQERLLHLVVDKITVNPDGLVLVLKADGISSVIAELVPDERNSEDRKVAAESSQSRGKRGAVPSVDTENGRITLRIPMPLKRRSGRKEIILPNGNAEEASPVQESLATAVARAHRWLQLLEDGRFNSVSELAEAVDLDPSLVRRNLNLTLLRPDLVRRILAGDEPDGLSLRVLLKDGVPLRWEEQG